METLQLTEQPTVQVGMLIRAKPETVFQALVDPAITTKIWFTRSSGRVVEGADLTWEWEMYGASSQAHVEKVEENSLVRFTWSGYDPENPTTVEFQLSDRENGTYLQVLESGFSGDGDAQVTHAIDSTGGFTFFVSALKALLEHGIELSLVADAHPDALAA